MCVDGVYDDSCPNVWGSTVHPLSMLMDRDRLLLQPVIIRMVWGYFFKLKLKF